MIDQQILNIHFEEASFCYLDYLRYFTAIVLAESIRNDIEWHQCKFAGNPNA